MKCLYRGHRFSPEIISHAVWLYDRFTLSFCDVEDLLAERGVTVSYEGIVKLRYFAPRKIQGMGSETSNEDSIWWLTVSEIS